MCVCGDGVKICFGSRRTQFILYVDNLYVCTHIYNKIRDVRDIYTCTYVSVYTGHTESATTLVQTSNKQQDNND